MKKRYFISLFVVVLIIGYSLPCFGGWIVFRKPAYKGKIIDAETKEPIEDVVVVAVYNKYPILSGPGGGSSSMIHIREALTDKDGEFKIPSYITLTGPNSVEDDTTFIIYKPGYSAFPSKFPSYGNFSGYWATPLKDMSLPGIEHFFLEDNFGKHGEIILSFGPLKKGYGTYGLVELPRVTTKKERLKAQPSEPSEFKSDCPLLYKTVNEERKRFGLKPVGRKSK